MVVAAAVVVVVMIILNQDSAQERHKHVKLASAFDLVGMRPGQP